MTTYGFRIRFLLSKGQCINCDSGSLDLNLPKSGASITIRAVGAKSISDTDNIAIVGIGFTTKAQATECGEKLKRAVLLVGASLRIGIDPGKDQSRGGLGKVVRDMGRHKGLNIINDIHGLCVYDEDLPVSFCSVKGDVIMGTQADRFAQELTSTYFRNPMLSDKQVLSLELYNSSHFESSLRARFLSLVTAVEALVSRPTVSDDVVMHLDKLMDITSRSTLDEKQKYSINNGLGNIKQESISKACRSLVNQLLGNESEDQFKRAYKVRAKILHTGLEPSGVALRSLVPQLDELVSKLIMQDINSNQILAQPTSAPDVKSRCF